MLKRSVKGQSSVEYLSIVSIALLVLIPGSYLFLNYSRGTTEQVAVSQLNWVGQEIINEAEKMYVLGSRSFITLDISLPGNFIDARIVDGQELVFRQGTTSGITDVVFFPVGFNISNSTTDPCMDDCNLNLNVGHNRIRIWSQGEYVSIERRR